ELSSCHRFLKSRAERGIPMNTRTLRLWSRVIVQVRLDTRSETGKEVGLDRYRDLSPSQRTLRGRDFRTSYFTAATLALRRDLYRAAVFLWITPFFTALSITETVSPKAALACLASPDWIVVRSLRSAVRRREVLARLSSMRFWVWRARL